MTTPTTTHSICDACETVAHCSVNGCIPAIPIGAYHLRSGGLVTDEQLREYAQRLMVGTAGIGTGGTSIVGVSGSPATIYDSYNSYNSGTASTAPPPPPPATQSQPPEWTPVSQKLLLEQPSWLYEPCWIALNTGEVTTGYYHWREGRSPDRFITELGDLPAFDALYVAPIIVPTHPDARM